MVKSKKSIIALIAFILVIAALMAVYFVTRDPVQKGEKRITVEIIYDNVDKSVTMTTGAEYLGDALTEEGLIVSEDGAYGIFVTTVDGRVADDSAQEWWCITKGSETVNTGVDTTAIADGDTYELTLKTGW